MDSLDKHSRRSFVKSASAAVIIANLERLTPNWLLAQSLSPAPSSTPIPLFNTATIPPISFSKKDDVVLPEGYSYEILLKQGQIINDHGDLYGDGNDYLAIILDSDTSGWLWVNHEAAILRFIDNDWTPLRKMAQAESYLRNVGGSCLRIALTENQWRPLIPHSKNFRLNGFDTKILFTGPAAGTSWLRGASETLGTVANCGGGISPWKTFLSAEENYHNIWGDPEVHEAPSMIQALIPRSSHHYGYMVEIDQDTRQYFKHTALGRFAHENIAFTLAKDNRLVGYMGDDRKDQCLYKFISESPYEPSAGKNNRTLLEKGILYVANTQKGRWIPLDPNQTPALEKAGFDLSRICVHTRTASSIAGGTPLDRPEYVEIHPLTGDVYICLTAFKAPLPFKKEESALPKWSLDIANLVQSQPLPTGALAQLREANQDPGALEFDFKIFVMGGKETGLAWPDNLAWTDQNDLIVTSDYTFYDSPHPLLPENQFGNNSLMLVRTAGPQTGKVFRFASAPIDAEFCSPTISPDRQELWVNVQHPGIRSSSREKLTSTWPRDESNLPKSCMIAIRKKS